MGRKSSVDVDKVPQVALESIAATGTETIFNFVFLIEKIWKEVLKFEDD